MRFPNKGTLPATIGTHLSERKVGTLQTENTRIKNDMERRMFIYTSEFIRAICKTNAEPSGLRLTTRDFSTRAYSSQNISKGAYFELLCAFGI